MKAILFLAASILALTSAVLADECTWGVSYWCQNKANAEKCDKVSYCNDHVWNQKGKEGIDDLKDAILLRGSPVRQFYKKYDQKPTEPQSIQCEICKVVVKEAVKYLDDNKTETEVKDAVENVCTLFGSFESQCKDLIDSYFDEIWQLLVNNVTPDEVCSEIQLCASRVKSDVPLKRGRGKGVSSNCRLCDNFRNIIVHASRDHVTRSKAKEKLRTTCKGLKMKETKCDKFIDEHFMHLWRGVMKEATSSSTCKNMFPDCSVPVPHHRARRSLECYACKEGVSILMKYIKKSSMKTKITDAANKLCTSFLPPKDLQHCEALLDPVVGIAWEDILTIMINHTDEVCSFIGACSSKSRMMLAQNIPSQLSTKSIIKHKNVKQDLCGTCKMVISFIKPYVDSNSTEQEVKDALNAICGLLPGSTKDECTSFVKTYFPTIWTLIKTEVDSGDVCKQIGLCPNATMAISKREVKKNSLILKSKIVKQDLCTTCKLAVTFAKPFVDSNSTEQEVKEALETVCGVLPNTYKSQCTDLIEKYFSVIWGLLESEFDHDLICYQLRLCTNSTGLISLVKERLSKVDFKSVNVDSCSLCKEVVDILQPYANSSTTEAVVKNALMYVCGYLSDVLNMTSLSQECTDAVKVYFGIVWEIMKDELANDLICSQLNLCNSIQLSYHKKFSSAQCVECELLTKYVYDYLKSSSSEDEIKGTMLMVCSYFGSMENECKEYVNEYFPMIWPELLNILSNSKQLCTTLRMCQTNYFMEYYNTKVSNVKASPLCFVCEMLMKELDKLILTNSTEAEITAALDKVCSMLPSTVSSECKSLVDKYGPAIINAIISGTANRLVCSAIGLCALSDKVPVVNTNIVNSVVGTIKCDACEATIYAVKEALNLSPSVLKDLCKLISNQQISTECGTIVGKYGSELIKVLTSLIQPKALCQDFKVCSK